MGVGGRFWDILKPYARPEDVDFLRDKKVAVDLSFWVVQNETAIKGPARKPHLRLIFFRTLNIFSKLGALPVFVVDGTPLPLKGRARAKRFLRVSGYESYKVEGSSVPRNRVFTKHIEECTELLQLMGMPILRAEGEAEALCAQLNLEGYVDACITADSDAFLYGAKCVIKSIRPNSKEPFECYHASDIEARLGLRRNQLVAMALLIGNDHHLEGVPGIGVETALRFVRLFSDDEVLNRLQEIGKGGTFLIKSNLDSAVDLSHSTLPKGPTKTTHCSNCGHPGSKKDHLKLACEYCKVYGNTNCAEKPIGFRCECTTCDAKRRSKEQRKKILQKDKEQRKNESWQMKVFQKIAYKRNFPNVEIMKMYLNSSNENICHEEGGKSFLLWDDPRIEILIDFLAYHQKWEPSFIRQRMFPMLSTIFLRKVANKSIDGLLLHDQYEFHSIQRVKVRYGHSRYLVKWKGAALHSNNSVYSTPSNTDLPQSEVSEGSEIIDVLDDDGNVPQVLLDDEGCFLLTDENMDLVKAAFPQKVDAFLLEKELKESKSKSNSSLGSGGKRKAESHGNQLSITEFYRSTKVKHGEESAKYLDCSITELQTGGKKTSTNSPQQLSKSIRRHLLFD